MYFVERFTFYFNDQGCLQRGEGWGNQGGHTRSALESMGGIDYTWQFSNLGGRLQN